MKAEGKIEIQSGIEMSEKKSRMTYGIEYSDWFPNMYLRKVISILCRLDIA